MARPRALVSGLLLAGLIGSGPEVLAASDAGSVHSSDYPGIGRIVIDANSPARYKMQQIGDPIVARSTDGLDFGRVPGASNNVAQRLVGGATAEFIVAASATAPPETLSGHAVPNSAAPAGPSASGAFKPVVAPNVEAKPKQVPAKIIGWVKKQPAPLTPSAMARSPELGGRVLESASAIQKTPATQTAATPPGSGIAASGTAPLQAVTAKALPPPDDSSSDSTLEATQPETPGRDILPGDAVSAGLMALPAKAPKGFNGSAFVVPFPTSTGVAVFQGHSGTYVVFDERRPIDMASLHDDTVFGQADVQLLPGGTLLRLPLPPGISVVLSQTPRGWRIAGLKVQPKSQPIVPAYADGAITLAAEQPGDVVSMADPDTGASLLVGTTRRPNQAVVSTRYSADFILSRTSLGVVVEPLSDAITMKVIPTGFILTGRAGGLAVSPPTAETEAQMDAVYLTRRFDFPTIPTEALLRRLIKQNNDTAMTPPRARGPKRQAAALTMIALGMAAEAEGLLLAAAAEDPKLAASPDMVGLTAIAALLAGRLAETDGLNDPRLTGTDDIALWRAVRQAMQDEGSPAAAAILATTAPLAILYPKPISDRILPLIVETMVEGGEVGKAAQLLAKRKADIRLNYARALQKAAEGDTDQALAMLDDITAGHDQFDRARAGVRAVELRLSSRKITPTQAADALDALAFTWRGDQRELSVRERIASLRGQAGAWRTALSTLRQAEADFPDQAKPVHALLNDAFANMVTSHDLAQMSPIDVVSAIDENADLIPAKGGNPALEEQLAERLLALDLPGRAKPVLEKLMKSAVSPASKARYGATLAALNARENNDAAALAALDASEAQDLPADLIEKRTLLRADAMARTGHVDAAAAALQTLGTPAATEARAAILEQAQDWAGAERAWSDYATKSLPETGALGDDQARALLRLTTAAARAGDEATLATLRARYSTRLANGAFDDMFRLLTEEPVHGTGDLKRARQEATLAQSLPANLKALDGSPATH